MYIRPTAPRSIGGVLDDGFRLWRAAFAKTWPVALMAQLLALIPVLIVLSESTAATARTQPMTLMLRSPGLAIAYLVVAPTGADSASCRVSAPVLLAACQ